MKIVHGESIGKQRKILVECTAVIFDETRQKVLLPRRTGNGKWCLPGGCMESDESAAETCIREVKEETGLSVKVKRLVGVYTNPNRFIDFPDGNKFHLVALNFEVEIVGGELATSDETTEFGYFSLPQIYEIDLLRTHVERIEDVFQEQPQAFVK